MEILYAKELVIAELAVQRAALLTKQVLNEIDKNVISKDDASPVTIADFAAQALLISAVHHNFPKDTFVGEEAADALRKDLELQNKVWGLVCAQYLESPDMEALLSRPASVEEMLEIIDLGCGPGGREGRIWILDPIDGTAAFMKGEQYAISLALVEDGIERVGVLGCPNLDLATGGVHENQVDKEGYGMMLSAVQGQGAFMRHVSSGKLEKARKIESTDLFAASRKLHWVDGTSSSSNDHLKHQHIAGKIGVEWPGTDLYSSQMRYAAIAVGGGDILLAIPKKREYKSWVWDHAGGHLMVKESGKSMADLNGKDLDFGAGRYLEHNYGRLIAPLNMRDKILELARELSA